MKAEIVNPFLEAVFDVFNTMLDAPAERGEVKLTKETANPYDLMALVGISGESRGTVAIALPSKTALGIVGRIAGIEFEEVDETVVDGIAEIINMIGGSAKAKIGSEGGKPMDLGLPTVVRGEFVRINHPMNTAWLQVGFESDLGPFLIRITFEEAPN